ncbi:MAG: hypothetical protein IJX88_05385 [Clostridia bacterium]|nr:hypothetical protein [Clostridia bacterium]
MKKILALALCLFLSCGFFVACNAGDKDSSGKGTQSKPTSEEGGWTGWY